MSFNNNNKYYKIARLYARFYSYIIQEMFTKKKLYKKLVSSSFKLSSQRNYKILSNMNTQNLNVIFKYFIK